MLLAKLFLHMWEVSQQSHHFGFKASPPHSLHIPPVPLPKLSSGEWSGQLHRLSLVQFYFPFFKFYFSSYLTIHKNKGKLEMEPRMKLNHIACAIENILFMSLVHEVKNNKREYFINRNSTNVTTWIKTWIAACPLGKRLSHFPCLGPLLAPLI